MRACGQARRNGRSPSTCSGACGAGREVVRQRPVVGAPLVPDHEVGGVQLQRTWKLGFSRWRRSQSSNNAPSSACMLDAAHEVAAQEEHVAPGLRVRAHERVHHGGNSLAARRASHRRALERADDSVVDDVSTRNWRQTCCITGDSASYAAPRLAHMVSPPRAGISTAWRNAIFGGSSIHVMSVCHPSASGGLGRVDDVRQRGTVGADQRAERESGRRPNRRARSRCSSSVSDCSRKNSTPCSRSAAWIAAMSSDGGAGRPLDHRAQRHCSESPRFVRAPRRLPSRPPRGPEYSLGGRGGATRDRRRCAIGTGAGPRGRAGPARRRTRAAPR